MRLKQSGACVTLDASTNKAYTEGALNHSHTSHTFTSSDFPSNRDGTVPSMTLDQLGNDKHWRYMNCRTINGLT